MKASVLLALVHAIRTKPAFGWVRNEGLENQELLKRLASLQDRYDKQDAELQSLRTSLSTHADTRKFRGLDSKIEIAFKFGKDKTVHRASVQLSDTFFACADEMLVPCTEYKLRSAMKHAVIAALPAEAVASFTRYGSSDRQEWLTRNVDVETDSLASVLRQFLALGLVEPEMVLRQSGDQKGTNTVSQRCWVLTSSGRATYLEKRALPAGDG